MIYELLDSIVDTWAEKHLASEREQPPALRSQLVPGRLSVVTLHFSFALHRAL
jgi:hypothetical protein